MSCPHSLRTQLWLRSSNRSRQVHHHAAAGIPLSQASHTTSLSCSISCCSLHFSSKTPHSWWQGMWDSHAYESLDCNTELLKAELFSVVDKHLGRFPQLAPRIRCTRPGGSQGWEMLLGTSHLQHPCRVLRMLQSQIFM